MPSKKLGAALAVGTIVVTGCGSAARPAAGPDRASGRLVSRGRVDDPRLKPNRFQCIRNAQLPVRKIGATTLQIGAPPVGATVVFQPTPGVAQGQQIRGGPSTQGAEVIGSALLYPNQASDGELSSIENCLAQGVTG